MTTSAPQVIPYGVPALDVERLFVREGQVDCPAPHVAVDAGCVLRLNDGQYAFPEPPDLRAMTGAAAQLDCLREHLKRFCDLWARPPKLFLDRYFDFIADRVERNRAALKARLARFGSLFDYRDWALSAPRPLPRAHLPVGAGVYCPVDMGFWLGDRMLAVLLAGSATPTGWDAERRAALEAAGVEIATLSVRDLGEEGVGCLDGSLPPGFDAFWDGEILPSSPFVGTSLGEIVRE